jgi:16S rRNA (cytosine967-C5)-methyltransferase
MTARDVARRVLERVERGGAWATPTLDGELARSGLPERDRRLAAELVYGVLRQRARVDRALAAHAKLDRTPPRVLVALRVAAYQLLFLDRVPAYAAVDDAVNAVRAFGGAKLGGFANAVLRAIERAGEPALPDEPRARIEIEASLPRWIVDELARVVGEDELASRARAFAEPAPLVARVNRRRTTRDALVADLTGEGASPQIVPEVDSALTVDGLGDPAKSPSFLAGKWTVQDAGAQRVAFVAAPRAGMRVLDACAGVGGKSTHLAELADDGAVIDAADRSTTKLALAAETAARLGLTSVRGVACDLTDPRAPLADAYDLIVLDAPCSGLGVLRRHPDAKWRLQASDVPRLAAIQASLLDAVVSRLAPGGVLVYSVCTFTRAEGPDQIAALRVRHPDLALVAEHRTWPPSGDAFYLARLERAHRMSSQ